MEELPWKKSSFKIIGEQIDGAFTFDGTDFLLEAKWQKEPIPASELYAFGGKITNKLKNTLGLFISIDGFSKDGIETNNPITKQKEFMYLSSCPIIPSIKDYEF